MMLVLPEDKTYLGLNTDRGLTNYFVLVGFWMEFTIQQPEEATGFARFNSLENYLYKKVTFSNFNSTVADQQYAGGLEGLHIYAVSLPSDPVKLVE